MIEGGKRREEKGEGRGVGEFRRRWNSSLYHPLQDSTGIQSERQYRAAQRQITSLDLLENSYIQS